MEPKKRNLVEHDWKCPHCKVQNSQILKKNDGKPICKGCSEVKPNERKQKVEKDSRDYNPKDPIKPPSNNEYGINNNSEQKKYRITPLKNFGDYVMMGEERYKKIRVAPIKELDNHTNSDNPKIITNKGFELIMKVIGNIPVVSKKVLDIGCGRGELLNCFLNEGFKVIGIEKDELTFSKILPEVKNYCINLDAAMDTSWLAEIPSIPIIIFSNKCFSNSIRSNIEYNIATLSKVGTFVIVTHDQSFVEIEDCVEKVKEICEPNICEWKGSIYCFKIVNPISQKKLKFPK